MPNTGYKGYTTLLKVTNDGTNRPLDINNNLCSESGLPQDSKTNINTDPDYVAPILDTTTCPITSSNYTWRFSTGAASPNCAASSYPIVYYSIVSPLVNGTQLYNDNACTIIATGGGDLFYKSQEQLQTMQISALGIISNVVTC